MSKLLPDAPRYLVVAHRTADSSELLARLRSLAEAEPATQFVLLVPAMPASYLEELAEGRFRPAGAIAADRARRIRQKMLEQHLNIVAARVGNFDPVQAIADELAYESYSGVILSTLSPGLSRWLRMDVPARLTRRFPDVAVTHVVAGEGEAGALEAGEVPTAVPQPGRTGRLRVQLDEEEVDLLERVLNIYLGDLRMEVRVTDNRRLRADLKHEEELVRRVMGDLHSRSRPPQRSRVPAGRPGSV
jgi:hypothetical protein